MDSRRQRPSRTWRRLSSQLRLVHVLVGFPQCLVDEYPAALHCRYVLARDDSGDACCSTNPQAQQPRSVHDRRGCIDGVAVDDSVDVNSTIATDLESRAVLARDTVPLALADDHDDGVFDPAGSIDTFLVSTGQDAQAFHSDSRLRHNRHVARLFGIAHRARSALALAASVRTDVE